MLFDTHAHYDDERFDGDREALLAGMPEKNVGSRFRGFTYGFTERGKPEKPHEYWPFWIKVR